MFNIKKNPPYTQLIIPLSCYCCFRYNNISQLLNHLNQLLKTKPLLHHVKANQEILLQTSSSNMWSQVFVSSSTSLVVLFPCSIAIVLTLITSIIVTIFFAIAFFLFLFCLLICETLTCWIVEGLPSHDHNDSTSYTGDENTRLLQIFWMEILQILRQKSRIEEQEQREEVLEMMLPSVSYKSKEGDSSSDECVICLDNLIEGDSCRVFPVCKHIFHLNCIDRWLKDHVSCPICRRVVVNVYTKVRR